MVPGCLTAPAVERSRAAVTVDESRWASNICRNHVSASHRSQMAPPATMQRQTGRWSRSLAGWPGMRVSRPTQASQLLQCRSAHGYEGTLSAAGTPAARGGGIEDWPSAGKRVEEVGMLAPQPLLQSPILHLRFARITDSAAGGTCGVAACLRHSSPPGSTILPVLRCTQPKASTARCCEIALP